MATTEFIAAIELGSSKISGIAGRKNSDGSLQVLAHACEESASFVRKGIVYNIDKAASALTNIISKLEKQLDKCTISKVYVGIGGQSLRTVKNTVCRTLDEEDIISENLIDSICDENRDYPLTDMDILDVVPQEYKIDNKPYTEPKGVTGRNIIGEFQNIVARTQLKKNLERSLQKAQIEIADDPIVAPIALAKSVLTEAEMRSGCALVDLGADTTTVLVYKNRLLRYLAVLPLGGNNITKDLTTLRLEEEEAEKLKLQYGDALYKEEENEAEVTCQTEDKRSIKLSDLNDIIGARIEEIVCNVNEQIKLSKREKELNAGIILTGGGAKLKNMEAAFRQFCKAEKVKTILFVQTPVHGCSETLKKDGMQNTLLALLEAGKENCCKLEEQQQKEPKDLFGYDETLKEQEEAARAAKHLHEEEEKKRRKEEEEEKKRKKEEEEKKKKDAKKKIFTFFGKLTDSLLEDDSSKF